MNDDIIDSLADSIYNNGSYYVYGNFDIDREFFKSTAKSFIGGNNEAFNELRCFFMLLGWIDEDKRQTRGIPIAPHLLVFRKIINGKTFIRLRKETQPKAERFLAYCDRILENIGSYDTRRKEANSHISKRSVRDRILKRDKYECQSCGSNYDLEIDHIIPVVRMGGNEDSNLQVLCKSCNCSKGGRR